MPELPEVETIRRSLEPLITGRRIIGVRIILLKALRGITPEMFTGAVSGETIKAVERRGKYLILRLTNNMRIIFHLRMTGRLVFSTVDDPAAKYTTMVLEFEGGKELRFEDTRKFGTIDLLDEGMSHPMNTLGPEPLAPDWSAKDLSEAAKNRQAAVKGFLLDQKVVAGLGNIYADEALFRAKINPNTPANAIKREEWVRLHDSIRTVLTESIKYKGTTARDFVDGQGHAGAFQTRLNVYGRTNQPCLVCGTPIHRQRIAGRSSHFCPVCQPEYK
jgi:formamidopyrimidine-DNA glycosylase